MMAASPRMPDHRDNADAYRKAVAFHRAGKLKQAERLYRIIIDADPCHVPAITGLANVNLQSGRLEEGIRLIDRSLTISGDQPNALKNRGIALWRLGRLEAALLSFDRAISVKSDYVDAFESRGDVLRMLERPHEALGAYDKAVELRPDSAELFNKRANLLCDLDRPEQALSSYRQAIMLKPDFATALNNLGKALVMLNRRDEALKSFERAIALQPDFVGAVNNRGSVLYEMGQLREALSCFDRVIALKPDFAEAFNNRGNVLHKLGRLDEALRSFDHAVSLRPDYALALSNRSSVLDDINRPDEAIACRERALALDPKIPYLRGVVMRSHALMCDMTDRGPEIAQAIRDLERGEKVFTPFLMLSIPATPAQQKRCAEIYVRDNFQSVEPASLNSKKPPHERIRLGYFSADYYDHATAYLTAGLFEQHDRNQFEVIGYSLGVPRMGAMRDRLSKAFDRFEDVHELSDEQIAQLAQNHQIDIAIDLKGFTWESRAQIFARRAAPIQVNYLGYPGTMGADFIDYIIADAVLIPEEHRKFYSEKVAYLPDSYQVNDRKREIAARAYTRTELGLPESGFIFCCLNNSWKITYDAFQVWMRLLHQVPGSVLWLLVDHATARENLTNAAERLGIDPSRICFAQRVENADYLARYQVADLFLDTFICNAHTTASDALWAGLPVLTCLGSTFAGRVAASLLTAVGLTEMITYSPAEYEALALDLATNSEKLRAIRQKLSANRLTYPLFDTQRFTRNLEAAYQQMWQRHQRGLFPEHIRI